MRFAGGDVGDDEGWAALARVDSHLPLPAEVCLPRAVADGKRVMVDAPARRPVVLWERAAVYRAEVEDGDAQAGERERRADGGVWVVAGVRERDPPSLRAVPLHRVRWLEMRLDLAVGCIIDGPGLVPRSRRDLPQVRAIPAKPARLPRGRRTLAGASAVQLRGRRALVSLARPLVARSLQRGRVGVHGCERGVERV